MFCTNSLNIGKNHVEVILDCSHSFVWLVPDYKISNLLVFISNFINPLWERKGQVPDTVNVRFSDVCDFPESVLEAEFCDCFVKEFI